MADTLTYILDLQDNISSKLKKINITNDEQLDKWAKVEKVVNDANKSMNNMGRSIGSISQKLNALKAQREWIPIENRKAIKATNKEIQKLEKELNKLNNMDGGGVKKWFGNIKNIIPSFINPLSMASLAIGKAVKSGASTEMAKTNLTTLFQGDMAQVEKYYSKISNYAIKTPYEKTDLIEGQKTMMSFCISAEKSFKTLQHIGDIAMGDSQKMQSLTLAFSQATSAGKLQGQDLLQMINAGFNPLEQISKKTGKSIAQLKDEMAKGKITSDMLSEAFEYATSTQGLFYKGAEKASQTLGGKWSNLQDNLSEIAINFYDKILAPILKPTLDVLNLIINKVSWFFTELNKGNTTITIITGLIVGLTAGLLAYNVVVNAVKWATALWEGVQWAMNVALSANPIGAVIALIVALVGVIAFVVMKTNGWKVSWQGAMTGMRNGVSWFTEMATLKFLQMVNFFEQGIDKVLIAWYKFKDKVGLGDSDENQKAIAKINADMEQRKKAIEEGKKKVEQYAKASKEGFNQISLKWDKNTKLSDGTAKIKDKLGINNKLENNANNGLPQTNTHTNNGKTSEAIVNGGTRSTNVNISFKNLIENMRFEGGFEENASNMEQQVAEALFRVLNMAQSSVG